MDEETSLVRSGVKSRVRMVCFYKEVERDRSGGIVRMKSFEGFVDQIFTVKIKGDMSGKKKSGTSGVVE